MRRLILDAAGDHPERSWVFAEVPPSAPALPTIQMLDFGGRPDSITRMIKSAMQLSLTSLLIFALPLCAATYHVDFAGGDNAADGLSPQTAWKHSPGDPSATDKP